MNREVPDWASLYDTFLHAYGPQNWWPGHENPFEVVVGAILTQRTTWTNASCGVVRLREAGVLTSEAIRGLETARLEDLIRPAGFYRAKAATLKVFCDRVEKAGGLSQLLTLPMNVLRSELLLLRGIGEETADAILVYAAGVPSFVVDAYTRRLLERLGWILGNESYGEIQTIFSRTLPRDVAVYAELHALIIHHGKTTCRPRPKCEFCPVVNECSFAKNQEVQQ
jgi:endonuclease III related protein